MKKKDQRTFLDRQIIDKQNELMPIRTTMEQRVKNILVKEKAVSLYPNGPDRNKAIDDLETAKQKLLCSIGSYDCRLMEYSELLKKTSEKDTMFGSLPPCTSHECIEFFIRGLIF